MKKLILFALLALPLGVWAQSAAVKKIMEMSREDNRVMEHLDVLCNRFGGRLVGSAGFENSQAWIVKQLEEWGLEVTLEKAGEVPVGFNRGGWWGRAMGEYSETLYFTTPSYTAGTKGKQRGHVVIEPRTQAQFDRMKGTLKGAWVLMESKSTGWPLEHSAEAREARKAAIAENAEIAQYNRQNPDNPKPMNEMPALFYDEMIEAGVLGFIQPTTVPIRTLYDRKMLNEGKVTFETLPTVPDIKLDEEQFERIYKLAQQRRHVELEFDIRNYWSMGPVPYHNIVATIKGSKKPNEYVILGSHLDAFDVATGGVDCGSGVSAMMEAARMIALSGAKPERSIVFIFFAAEEFGLFGSLAWVRDHKDKWEKISNMFNRDGGPLAYTAFSAPASLVDEYEEIAKPIQELYPDYNFTVRKLEPRAKPTQTGGNDSTSFMVEGIPALQMSETDPSGYNFQYQEIWHTDRDIYNKSIPEYQEQAATALAIMALGTANLPTLLPRNEVYK